jgi:glutamyl-tRNA synthetase
LGIEETIQGKDTESMMLLEKFALKHDRVFHQSEHTNFYHTLVLRLLKEKKAFISHSNNIIDTDNIEAIDEKSYTQLKESGKKVEVYVKNPSEELYYTDFFQGQQAISSDEIGTFSILEEDGTPSYDFAIASDDMMNDIHTIVKGAEDKKSTFKQLYLKTLLGYENSTQYIHLPKIILGSEKFSLKSLLQKGYLPDAIINYLLILGYKLPKETIFTLPSAISWFDINALSTSTVNFDVEVLKEINKEHLKQLDDKRLSKLFGFADAEIGKLAKLYLEECATINELKNKIDAIFTPKNFKSDFGTEMKIVSELIAQAPAFKTFDELTAYLKRKSSINEQELHKVLRYLLTGVESGPELSKVYPFIKSYILEVAS